MMLSERYAPPDTAARLVRAIEQPRAALAVIVGTFVAIDVLRTLTYQPGDGASLLYAIPIAIAAARFGARIGALTGLAAYALFAFWVWRSDIPAITPLGFATRFVVFVLLGMIIGMLARARNDIDRRSRLLVDVSPDLMAIVDDGGEVRLANQAWRDTAGIEHHPGALLQSHVSEPGVVASEQAITFAGGDIRWFDWRERREEGSPWRCIVGRDVTNRHAQAIHIQQLLSEVQETRDDERQSIASELHDFVLQKLLVATMHLEPIVDGGGPDAAVASRVDAFVRDAIADLRRVVDGIRPLDLEHLSLGATLELAVQHVRDAWQVDIQSSIDVVGSTERMDRLLAYRVLGESLRNAAKHANATSIDVVATCDEHDLHLRVVDDGVGMSEAVNVTGRPDRVFGTGFNLLIEQVRAAGGIVEVESTPGAGTTVSCRLPL